MLFEATYLMEDNEEYVYIIETSTHEKARQYMIEDLIEKFGSIDNTTQGEMSVNIMSNKEGIVKQYWLSPEN